MIFSANELCSGKINAVPFGADSATVVANLTPPVAESTPAGANLALPVVMFAPPV